jgi:hypothetical protein
MGEQTERLGKQDQVQVAAGQGAGWQWEEACLAAVQEQGFPKGISGSRGRLQATGDIIGLGDDTGWAWIPLSPSPPFARGIVALPRNSLSEGEKNALALRRPTRVR